MKNRVLLWTIAFCSSVTIAFCHLSFCILAKFPFFMSHQHQKWFPLESNPQLINEYLRTLGVDMSLYEFVDVYSTDDWALEMIPQPVAAVLLLYPLTETIVRGREMEQTDILDVESMQDQVWFMAQRIGNACGTVGLLHAIMNAPPAIRIFEENSWMAQFADDCPLPLSPTAKAERLENDNGIAQFHDAATASHINATQRGNRQDKILTHFVAFIHSHGQLYELDGRKVAPLCHGPTTQATLLQDVCRVIQQKIMRQDPSETRFAITAWAPKVS